MYFENADGIGGAPIPPKRPMSPSLIAKTEAVRMGKVSAEDAFINFYQKDSNGRISQESFINFWGSDRVTKDAAIAIFANYDKDGNGLDAKEYAKYQKEYVQSLKGIDLNSNSLFKVGDAEQWEREYINGIKNGKIDYSTFSNYKAQSNNTEENKKI